MKRVFLAVAIFLTFSTMFLKIFIRQVTWIFDYNIEEKIKIKDTNWNAEIRSNRCFGSCNSYQGVDIRLINMSSGSNVLLVEGANVLNDELSSTDPGELRITLANLTVATIHDAIVPGVHVTWNFIPRNNPEERNAHRLWELGDRKLESNRTLYCQYVFPNIPENDRAALDRELVRRIYGENNNKDHYCLN